MKHPEREEWIPYLYRETTPDVRRRLAAHLSECPACREQLQTWQHSQARLDSWKMSSVRPRPGGFAPLLKWAAAAALVLAIGFGAGRLSAKPDVNALRAALEPQLRQDLARLAREEAERSSAQTRSETQAMLAAYASSWDGQRRNDNQLVRTALDRLELQTLSLKKELDTVAVNTDAGLEQTEQQLAQLIVYNPPTAGSPQQKQIH